MSQVTEKITERWITSGERAKRIRQAHSLPFGWRQLTRHEVELIRTSVVARARSEASLIDLETCLLLWAALVTGRHPKHLIKLQFRSLDDAETMQEQPDGLFDRARNWSWWLPAASPPGQKKRPAGMRAWSSHLFLPATRLSAELIGLTLKRRSTCSTPRPQALFTSSLHQLSGKISELLADRQPKHFRKARQATSTPEAVARWLPGELSTAPGGDPATASIITGRITKSAETSSYYGSIAHHRAMNLYNAAIANIDEPAHGIIPDDVKIIHIGEFLTPSDETVRGAIGKLCFALEKAQFMHAQHTAMLNYTAALLSFALAHRGSDTRMPASGDIDTEARLNWISDKRKAGEAESNRLAWVSQIAVTQMQLYEEHLDKLLHEVDDKTRQTIVDLRSLPGLPLFSFSESSIEQINIPRALKIAFAQTHLRANSGRHWLRANLAGKCSTETLDALYGHGPIKESSWDRHSTLDPSVYRADLARVLDPSLAAIGWAPRTYSASVSAR